MNSSSERHSLKWWLSHPLELFIVLLLSAICLTVFAQVVFRYCLSSPLSWSEEGARYMLIWLSALGASYAFKQRAHFSLLFMVKHLGEKEKKTCSTFIMLGLVIFFGIFIWKGWFLVWYVSRYQIAPATQISMVWPYSAAPVGGCLMLYYIVRNWWFDLKDTSAVFHDQDVDEAEELMKEAKKDMEKREPGTRS